MSEIVLYLGDLSLGAFLIIWTYSVTILLFYLLLLSQFIQSEKDTNSLKFRINEVKKPEIARYEVILLKFLIKKEPKKANESKAKTKKRRFSKFMAKNYFSAIFTITKKPLFKKRSFSNRGRRDLNPRSPA